jgi:hypothetical protein
MDVIPAHMATTDPVGSVVAVNLQRHESACDQRQGLSLPDFRTLFVSLLSAHFELTNRVGLGHVCGVQWYCRSR